MDGNKDKRKKVVPQSGGTTALNSYQLFWRKIWTYSGRTTRQNYWLPVVITWCALVLLYGLAGLLSAVGLSPIAWVVACVATAFSLASMAPSLAAMVRRLRDAGEKWTRLFLVFIPLAGPVIVLLLLCKKSVPPKRRRRKKRNRPARAAK